MNQVLKVNFSPVYRIAQYLSLIMLILIPLQIAVFIISPPPATVKEFFELFQQSPFLGLLSLDFLYLFNNAIIAVIYLALFILLYNEKPVSVILAFMLGLIGIACYYPSNPAFEMMTLSHQFTQALPELKSIYLAAGEAVMASYTGTTFNAYYVLSTLCLLLFSYAILKSRHFHKSVGLWGLVSGFFMIVPSSAGKLGMVFSLLSLVPWVIFVILLMNKFKKLALNHPE